jgi:ubiquitin-conjugating enzyme E2 G1
MLNDPNVDSPANIDAAKQLKEDTEGYNKKVKKLTQQSVDYL